MFMETSAKAGHNVKSLFKKIALSLPGMDKDGQAADSQNQSKAIFRSCLNVINGVKLEIDVTTTKTDVPEASSCQC